MNKSSKKILTTAAVVAFVIICWSAYNQGGINNLLIFVAICSTGGIIWQCYPKIAEMIRGDDEEQASALEEDSENIFQEQPRNDKLCRHCGQMISPTALACPKCGEPNELQTLHGKEPSSAIRKYIAAALIIGLFVYFGHFHIVIGGAGLPVVLVPRISFGYSDMIVDMSSIDGQPALIVKVKYPAALKALEKAGLVKRHVISIQEALELAPMR
jgi:ribosomal protein L40E